MGVLTALAIAGDTFPEGLVTFFSALREPEVGVAIVVAVALHHIPAGTSGRDGGLLGVSLVSAS
jgi:ZIP family zinc transporter